ncbi:ABC transporter [Fervidicella metallireducens AeB]|uniref:ABC transporter n=1 Tax=Fervidicella metallireducens AeB TaxID=1403537 RepID=A0A017RRJ8_9CLOT|nr:ABC transporter ATP-binding protein [Fervidicella metallireducens]EYE87277.1 ABC transporter [Fervidicella metallireducens AeB]
MKKIKLIWKLMKGNRLIYLASILSIALATFFSILIPLVTKTIIDSIIGNGSSSSSNIINSMIEYCGGREFLSNNLWICSLLIVLLTALNGLFLYLKGRFSSKAAESTAMNTREKLFNHIQRLPYDYHVKASTGDLIQRCTSDVETIRSFLAVQFVEIGRAIFMVTLVSIIMFSLNVKLALVAMTAVPIIFTFAFIFFKKVQKIFLQCDESEGRLSSVIQENLTGIRVVRAFAMQKFEMDKFNKKNREFKNLVYKLIKLLALYWSISDALCLLQIGAILLYGSVLSSKGIISLGTLVVFTTYEGMLLWPVRQMGRILTDMGKSFVAATRIFEILDEPTEIMIENSLQPKISGEIEFKNLSFEYEEGKPVLRNLTFKVKKGQTVAILGPTGSGKTTLINLLLRLYDYKKGSIKIDGIELKEIDRKWIRQNVGIASQEPFLFSKTIEDNVKLGSEKASIYDVHEACKIASIHDNIQEFEKGYETMVGEKGVTLSGGQKQRLTIARTVITDYPILIFDDSLSAVDAETDASIRSALRKRSKNVTTFIISHRISTIRRADLILVLEKGKISQMGTHKKLVNQDGLYKRVWEIQNSFEKEIEEDTNESAS